MTVLDDAFDISDEMEIILDSKFKINVTKTSVVPHRGDGAITFPNLDQQYQNCKLIETAILYIDIRGSTQLNQDHRVPTVAKLYSAFVRAMTKCAHRHNGRVRGIIGDRVMVIFDSASALKDALDTAFLMNSVCKFLLNKHFKANDVCCGIGLDFGRMLATKTGVRKHGHDQGNYSALVWLGRPANAASKLTDAANKTTMHAREVIRENYYYASTNQWYYADFSVEDFLKRLTPNYIGGLSHVHPNFSYFSRLDDSYSTTTPPILVTESVYQGFKKAYPQHKSIVEGWWEQQDLSVPGYSGKVFGADIVFTAIANQWG